VILFRIKTRLLSFAIWLIVAIFSMGFADDARENVLSTNHPPSAEALLAQVRSSIPQETLRLKGKLMKGERIGRLEQAYLIEALLELGKNPPSALYILSDAFGTPIARLTVIRPPGRAPEFRYEHGQPLRPATTPDMNQPIEGTELTWNDLSLSYLWWPDGSMAGHDNIRGRDCYVVELPVQTQPGKPPPTDVVPKGTKKSPPYPSDAVASVRLWIDDHLIVLIQLEEYDAEGKLMRRLSVKNFKKIADLWMVKNMDIRRYPSRHRTQIRIEEVISVTASNTPADVDLDE